MRGRSQKLESKSYPMVIVGPVVINPRGKHGALGNQIPLGITGAQGNLLVLTKE